MKTIITIVLLFTTYLGFGQFLNSHSINLNSGGQIRDVKYISGMDAYVVVGSFSSVNGTLSNNIAFLKSSDFSVITPSPVGSSFTIEGPINAVEYKKQGIYDYLIIGGEFAAVNGLWAQGLALFTHLGTLTQTSTFNFFNWDYATLDQASVPGEGSTYGNGVKDLKLIGDTLLVGGKILGINVSDGTSHSCGNGAPDLYDKPFFALKLNVSAPSRFQVITASSNVNLTSDIYNNNVNSNTILSLNTNANSLFLAGGNTTSNGGNNAEIFKRYDWNFNNISSFVVYPTTTIRHYFSCVESLNDTIIAAMRREGGVGAEYLHFYSLTQHPVYTGSQYVSDWNVNTSVFGNVKGFVEYNRNLLVFSNFSSLGKNTIRKYGLLGQTNSSTLSFGPVGTEQLISPANLNVDYLAQDTVNNLFIEHGMLFCSIGNMTKVNGQTRTGAAVFCLEPKDPQNFIAPDTVVCFGNEIIYSIPQSEYAHGYKWTYSGTGLKYRVAGSTNPYLPFNSSVSLHTDTANSVEFQFNQNLTPGVLSVTPYLICNISDTLFAKTKSINLTLAPLPTISLQDTATFTCVSDTLTLVVSSSTPNVTYQWNYQNSVIGTNDSLQLNTVSNPINNSYYFGSVFEPVNGCANMDSVFVYFDTVAAPVPLNSYIQNPPSFNCLSNSVDVDLAIPNATIEWAIHPDSTHLASPLTLYSVDTTNLYAFVTYSNNGCTAQQQFELIADDTTLIGTVNGVSAATLPTVFAMLNCSSPTLTLNAGLQSGTGTSEWIVAGNSVGSTLNLSIADTVGMNPTFHTKSYDLKTTNGTNGCSTNYAVTVQFDFAKPYVASLPNNSLNCSQSSINLVHPLTGGSGITEGWLDQNNNPTSNQSQLVTAVGEFYYQVTSSVNGCVNVDTVTIIQSNELILNLVSDTLVCPNQQVVFQVSNVNNTEPTTYTWSNGASGISTTALGGVNTELSVVAQNQSGCIGYDTVQILITPPVIASFVSSATCVEAAIQIAAVSGGQGPYQFAINNGNWQNTTFFDNLSFGTYTISIKDNLGCIYDFSQIIDGSAADPDVNFLVSTYNVNGDTLAIVNISNYTGYDSLVWTLPIGADVYSMDDSMVVVSIAQGGWYDVLLTAYIDTCAYVFSKPVFFGDEAPNFDQNYSAKGIQNLVLYPNPTTGLFTLEFTLGISQNYTVVVTNLSGQPLNSMSVSGTGSSFNENFQFPLGTPPGNYRIHIVADFDAKQQSVILSN